MFNVIIIRMYLECRCCKTFNTNVSISIQSSHLTCIILESTKLILNVFKFWCYVVQTFHKIQLGKHAPLRPRPPPPRAKQSVSRYIRVIKHGYESTTKILPMPIIHRVLLMRKSRSERLATRIGWSAAAPVCQLIVNRLPLVFCVRITLRTVGLIQRIRLLAADRYPRQKNAVDNRLIGN